MAAKSRASGWALRRVVAVTLVVVVIIAIALLSWELAPVLLLFFGGILAAIFLRALAGYVSRWTQLSNGWSLTIVLIGLSALAAGGFYFGGQAIATQMTELYDQVPLSLEKIREDLSQYEFGRWLIDKAPSSTEDVPISGEAISSYASNALLSLSGGFAAAVIVLFLAMYLAFDPETYVEGALRLLPLRKRKRVQTVLTEVHETLEWWLLGKIVSMLLVGIATSLGLALIGIPLAMALGVVAALLTFVPNFGPILSAIPAVLLAFVDSPMMAIYVVILYVVIQTVESYLITPLIQQKTVSLPPALTISTQVGMGILFGAAGVVLATPFTAAMLVLVKRLYVEDALEGRVATGGEIERG